MDPSRVQMMSRLKAATLMLSLAALPPDTAVFSHCNRTHHQRLRKTLTLPLHAFYYL